MRHKAFLPDFSLCNLRTALCKKFTRHESAAPRTNPRSRKRKFRAMFRQSASMTNRRKFFSN